MKTEQFEKAFVGAMNEMHEGGQEWVFMTDVARVIHQREVQTETYLRRYHRNSKILSLIGIHRPELPDRMVSSGQIYPTATKLEREGIIESEWREQGPDVDPPVRRGYRLIDLPLAPAA